MTYADTGLDWGDIPPPDDPPGAELHRRNGRHFADDLGPSTWEPVDLGPYLRGEVVQPQPSIGIRRSDGLKVIYAGREHSLVGETESGKTWFALACVSAELSAGHYVVYCHYEEGDPGSTIERLLLLGVDRAVIAARLRFVAPARAARTEWIAPLLDPPPTLVIHDGINEAMALHGDEIKDAAGAAAFRRRLVLPFLRVGAASIACDHLAKDREGRGRDAYGSVHKGNAIDGARILLENKEPFGRRMRGRSNVFVTKDRPGQLRADGRPAGIPGKTFIGTLIVDDSETIGPDFTMRFFAPKDDDKPTDNDPAAEVADIVYDVIAELPDHQVASMDLLYAEMRKAGHQFRDRAVREAIADLAVHMRVTEKPGKRGAKGYEAVLTSARESDT